MIGTAPTYCTNWSTMGNGGTSPLSGSGGTDYVGTSNNQNFDIGTNAAVRIHVIGTAGSSIGYVGINNTSPTSTLDVGGDINISSTSAYYKYGGLDFLKLLRTDNILLGVGAGISTTSTGRNNTFLGNSAGNANTDGVENTYVGNNAGYHFNTITAFTPSYNTFIGFNAGFGSTSSDGYRNVFVGHSAGYSHTTNGDNTFVGYKSGYLANAARNSFLGSQTGYNTNLGENNAFVGHYAGWSNYDGAENVMIGAYSGAVYVSGTLTTVISTTGSIKDHNIFVGTRSGKNYNGAENVFIGTDATCLGNHNVLIGNSATGSTIVSIGSISNSVAIGDHSSVINQCTTAVVANSIAIGPYSSVISSSTSAPLSYANSIGAYANVTTSNTMALGGTSTSGPSSSPNAAVVVVIGQNQSYGNASYPSVTYTTSPLGASTAGDALEINGDVTSNGTIWYSSDARFKKNISDFTNAKDIIRKMHPVKYEYRDDVFFKQKGSENLSKVKMNFTPGDQIGFLAQELIE
ncbi:MAG: tail fiber domain-containing protein, partial [Paludibacter sp.]